MAERKSYTERKEAWAAKMVAKGVQRDAVRSEERLPPGQHVSEKFPVLDLGIRPEVPPEEWRLEIGGLAEKPVSLDREAFAGLPRVERVSDFHCVTTWSVYDLQWGGVAFSEVLDLVVPREGAEFVFFTSYDGYTTNVRVEDLLDADAMLADQCDGKPLTREHGGPVRALLPKLYAWKSAKFIRKIEFLPSEEPGYWEKRGYSDTADPWTNDRFGSG